MNDTLREYLKKEFSGAPDTKENAALFEELLGNLTDRSRELMAEGMSETEAQRHAIDEMGDIRPLLHKAERGEKVKPSEGKIYPPEELRRLKIKRGIGVAGAVALYILSVVPALFGDLLALLLFPIAGAATAFLIVMLKSTSGFLDNSVYSYSPERNIRDNSRSNALLAIGVFFCIVSVVPPCIWNNAVGTALFFTCAAIGVFLIIFSCYLRPRAAAKELETEEIAGGPAAPQTGKVGVRIKKSHVVAWIVVTTVVLMLGGLITVLAVNDVECGFTVGSNYQQFADHVGNGAVEEAVKDLEISWRSGSVTVAPAPAGQEQITISVADKKGNSLPEDNSVYWGVKDGKLAILDEEPAFFRLIFGVRPRKYLTVLIPEGKGNFDTVLLDTVAANVSVSGLTAKDLSLDTTSGDIYAVGLVVSGKLKADSTSGKLELTHVSADVLAVDTTSGSVSVVGDGVFSKVTAESTSGKLTMSGNFVSLDADTTSGDIQITLSGGYDRLNLQSTSGDVLLEFSNTTNGFDAKIDSTSGKIAVDFPVEIRGNRYTSGDPTGEIRVETTSGNITFRKNAA